MKINRLFFLGVSFFGLTACSGYESEANLKAYIESVKTQTLGQIEPLPEVRPYLVFVYMASNLRSPFERPAPAQMAAGLPSYNGLRPDQNRQREGLEAFPIDSLRMLGTLEKKGKLWGIIKDSNATVYRVSIGNYIGQNYGHIDSVAEDKIQLTEIIPNGRGGWVERKATLALIVE